MNACGILWPGGDWNMEELLTIEQTADYLQVSVSTVRRMVRDGRLRSVSLGRLRRVPASALEELTQGAAARAVRIPVIVVEAGDRSIHPVTKLELELSGEREAMVKEAKAAVAARGYRVLANEHGGCCEYMARAVDEGGDHIVVTVWPKEED